MNNNWQSWAALAVVAATAAIMIYRTLVRKRTGCGAGCGCDTLKPKAGLSWKRESTRPPETQ